MSKDGWKLEKKKRRGRKNAKVTRRGGMSVDRQSRCSVTRKKIKLKREELCRKMGRKWDWTCKGNKRKKTRVSFISNWGVCQSFCSLETNSFHPTRISRVLLESRREFQKRIWVKRRRSRPLAGTLRWRDAEFARNRTLDRLYYRLPVNTARYIKRKWALLILYRRHGCFLIRLPSIFFFFFFLPLTRPLINFLFVDDWM